MGVILGVSHATIPERRVPSVPHFWEPLPSTYSHTVWPRATKFSIIVESICAAWFGNGNEANCRCKLFRLISYTAGLGERANQRTVTYIRTKFGQNQRAGGYYNYMQECQASPRTSQPRSLNTRRHSAAYRRPLRSKDINKEGSARIW